MSKPYQHHDPIADQGKAEPKPKAPNPIKMVSRFETHRKHPLTEKPFRQKPSRQNRIKATVERKKMLRKALTATV